MNHVAIMSKGWKWKQIESRWLINKSAPLGKVKPGDRVYFKDSGGPVRIRAEVEKVQEFTDLDKAAQIFGDASWKKDKKYCVLIWLKNPKKIEPFKINKAGFGSASAWLCVEDINKIRIY